MKLASIMLVLVLSCIVCGCVELFPRDPLFQGKVEDVGSQSSNAFHGRDSWLTYDVLVSYGWDLIYELSDPRYSEAVAVETAQDCFDEAWRMKKDGYDSYWGWGIIRLNQSKRSVSKTRRIQFLRDAIEYMELAKSKPSFEKIHFNSIQLDIAMCWQLLGREYHADNRLLEKRECFELSRTIIDALELTDEYEVQRAEYLKLGLRRDWYAEQNSAELNE